MTAAASVYAGTVLHKHSQIGWQIRATLLVQEMIGLLAAGEVTGKKLVN